MDIVPAIFILLSLILSAFFSGIEIAFISANKLRLAIDTHKESLTWNLITAYQKNPSRFISAALVGNNIALVIYGIEMGKVLNDLLAQAALSPFIILTLNTFLSTLLVLVTAEFLPKALFRINPILMLTSLIGVFRFFEVLLWPFIAMTRFISQFALRAITGVREATETPIFTRNDLSMIIGENTEITLDEEKSLDTEIFKNALEFKNQKVRECMRPRTEIIALDEDEGVEGLYQLFMDSRHSKIPIFRDTIDNIIGYVHQGAMFSQPASIAQILIPIVITNESRPVADVLKELTRQNKSMAVVVDEFGGTAGIITIEDIMEEILGEIEDEYDGEELRETIVKNGHYILSGRHEIDYLNKELKLELSKGDYETLGGYIIYHTDNIPKKGDTLFSDGIELKILSVENGRIGDVELKKMS